MENNEKPIKTNRSMGSRKRNIVDRMRYQFLQVKRILRIFSLIKVGEDFSFLDSWQVMERGMKCLGSFRSSTDRGIP